MPPRFSSSVWGGFRWPNAVFCGDIWIVLATFHCPGERVVNASLIWHRWFFIYLFSLFSLISMHDLLNSQSNSSICFFFECGPCSLACYFLFKIIYKIRSFFNFTVLQFFYLSDLIHIFYYYLFCFEFFS
jgi:hypothetical protein